MHYTQTIIQPRSEGKSWPSSPQKPTMAKNNKTFSKLFPVSIEKNPASHSCQIPEGGQPDLKILQEQQTSKH